MSRIKKNLIALALFSVLLMPMGAFAQTPELDTKGDVRSRLNEVAIGSGLTDESGGGGLVSMVAAIVSAALALVGVIVTLIIIYAGYLWMTAQGDAGQVKKAKEMMMQAVIGLAVTMGAYFISDFVVKAILGATLPE